MTLPTLHPAAALSGIVKQSNGAAKPAAIDRPRRGVRQGVTPPAATGCAVASADRERN